MNKKITAVYIMLSLFALCGSALAHHPTGVSGPGHAGPIRTISATTIEKGKLPVALDAELIDLDPFTDRQLLKFAGEGKDVHSADSVFHSLLGIGYGVTEDLSLGLKIPYVRVDNIREAHADEPDEIHRHGDSKGFGDMTLLVQYRFLRQPGGGPELALLLGLKLPTGETSDKDDEGERFETEFQPGSGSWDPMVGAAASKRFGSLALDANLLYVFSTRGAQKTDLGDSFQYNAAVSYRALRNGDLSWDLMLEANGEWKQKQKIGRKRDKNSGENVILLSPGTRFSWKQWSAYVSVGLPFIQELNGTQNKTDAKTLFGITVGF